LFLPIYHDLRRIKPLFCLQNTEKSMKLGSSATWQTGRATAGQAVPRPQAGNGSTCGPRQGHRWRSFHASGWL